MHLTLGERSPDVSSASDGDRSNIGPAFLGRNNASDGDRSNIGPAFLGRNNGDRSDIGARLNVSQRTEVFGEEWHKKMGTQKDGDRSLDCRSQADRNCIKSEPCKMPRAGLVTNRFWD